MSTIRDSLIGATVDNRYLVLGLLGRGATSSVYRAHDEQARCDVALKFLHSYLAGDETLVARFKREAETAKLLTHPNIVVMREYAVSQEGTPYLVMDFIEGITLQALLAKEGWLPLSKGLPIFVQICAGVATAHQKDVIHRDLKPGNIMLVPLDDGKYLVKILDFGSAQIAMSLGDTVMKITQTGEMLGSLLYMSPEQCLDQDVDRRSDCYSLGCVLYELLTGKSPLSARTAFETMNKHLTEMPEGFKHVRPDLRFPKGLERIVFKALAKSPNKRYQKVTDFMDDLLKYAGEDTRHLAIATVPDERLPDTANDPLKQGQAKSLVVRRGNGITSVFDGPGGLVKFVAFSFVLSVTVQGLAHHSSNTLPFFIIFSVICGALFYWVDKDSKKLAQ